MSGPRSRNRYTVNSRGQVFDHYTYPWKSNIDYYKKPYLYRIGKGEQGVLITNDYSSEISPYWKFKTPELARESSRDIYEMFKDYLEDDDFVGADIARKFLQMGYTRARRYTNYRSGRKYTSRGRSLPRGTGERLKGESAEIFYQKWQQAERNRKYKKMKREWKEDYG